MRARPWVPGPFGGKVWAYSSLRLWADGDGLACASASELVRHSFTLLVGGGTRRSDL